MIRGVLLDLDGTVHRGGRALPGAAEAVLALRAAGLAVVFLSNNPTVTAGAHAARLTTMGIPTASDEVITSGSLAAAWLRGEHPDAQVLLISEPSLRDELGAAGVALTDDPAAADTVVVSFDRTFDYSKWRVAFDALRRGARFVATNRDATCPVDGGGEVPDCAGIVAALEATTGRRLETLLGKPSPVAAEAALRRLSTALGERLEAAEVLVAGDRLETDIALGVEGGFATALLLSGVTRADDLVTSRFRPTHVLAGLCALPGIVLPGATGAGGQES